MESAITSCTLPLSMICFLYDLILLSATVLPYLFLSFLFFLKETDDTEQLIDEWDGCEILPLKTMPNVNGLGKVFVLIYRLNCSVLIFYFR